MVKLMENPIKMDDLGGYPMVPLFSEAHPYVYMYIFPRPMCHLWPFIACPHFPKKTPRPRALGPSPVRWILQAHIPCCVESPGSSENFQRFGAGGGEGMSNG